MAETDVRISELTDTTTSAANDDYIALDGATYGTRKMLASNLVGPEASARAAGDEALDGKIGTLSNLTTTAKGSAVAAINEVDSHADAAQDTADTNAAAIGTLSSLTTDAKGSLVAAINEVDSHADGKVDKVNGKGLSTNDYTDAEKTKLSGIEAGAEVNDVTSVAGKTGAVTLAGGDVSYSDETTYADGTIGAAVSELKSDLTQLESDVQSDLSDMQEEIDSFEGISEEVKVALLDVVSHIALWTDGDGQQYYDALYDALYGHAIPFPDLTTGVITKGYYYSATGDVVAGANDYINDKYFEIDHEQTYYWVRGFDGYVNDAVTQGATLAYRICYYDSEQNFISRQTSIAFNTFGEVENRYYELNIPEGAEYFRVSWQRFPMGNICRSLTDLYAVTLVLANLDDSNISSPTQLMDKVTITRDGNDVTNIVAFTKPDLKPSDWNSIDTTTGVGYWRYNVFNINQGGSPEYGNQNPATRIRITNRYSFLCKKGDVVHFNGVKAGVRAERISDGDVQHTTAWITDDSDFVIGGE